jgi:DNA helicase-2/ATP-dependent DNA helicase PcrA
MKKDKLIIAAAGAGKTTYLVRKSLDVKEDKILITTFTQANETEIRKKFLEINQVIPANVTIQTWFSFLLQHGVRPFQGVLYEPKINGLILVNGISGLKGRSKAGIPYYFREESEFESHYFSKDGKIFSDKISKFVLRANERSAGAVIERLSKIYSNIFIDEIQDLAGYDLELLKLLFASRSKILMVGDPRQGTLSTNSAAKNKMFKKSLIVNFFDDDLNEVEKDERALTVNYRCNEQICSISNKLFPSLPQTSSGNETVTDHDGVFLVKPNNAEEYLRLYSPIQLRDSIRSKTNDRYAVMNIGDSKGLSFDRILIYPTDPMLKWLKDKNSELKPLSRCKLYVALTRARFSVGVVCDYKNGKGFEHLKKWDEKDA